MTHRSRLWIAAGALLCVSSVAVNPVFAQTQPAPAQPGYPPPAAGQPGYPPPQGYPPPAQQGYPPPAAGQPGYPPQPYPPPAQGQYPPGQYAAPAPYGSPYPYQQVEAQPAGPPPMVHRARKGLLIAGAVTFGVTYGLAALVALSVNDDNDPYSTNTCALNADCKSASNLLYLPILGPVLAEAEDPTGYLVGSRGFAILWSVGQAAGLTMGIIGLIGHDVPDYGGRRRRASNLQLMPTWTATSSGFALRGTF